MKRIILLGQLAFLATSAFAQVAPPGTGTSQPHGQTGLTISGTGRFYSQNGATIDRVQDRMFTGAAAANDGAFPNLQKDWLSSLQTRWGHSSGYPVFSMLATLTNDDPGSGFAILGGAQTLHLGPTAAAIGVQGHAIANKASATASAWGLYGAAIRSCK